MKDRRPPDGLLHCSSDLIGSLRHAQLSVAGAPRLDTKLVSDIRLRTGTMWHHYLNDLLMAKGATVMQEIKVTPWLPEGWSGTADHLVWEPEPRAFRLWDLKTTKGEGIRWVSEGAKDEHIWQLSAYYHALREGKFPMLKKFLILYLPMNDVPGEDNIEPSVQEVVPLPKEQVWKVMEERWAATREYLRDAPHTYPNWITDKLAPPMERVQKLYKNGDKYELKLVPHWSTRFCPFPDELCDCNTQGTTKIGEWIMDSDWGENVRWDYTPRKGYENYDPQFSPR